MNSPDLNGHLDLTETGFTVFTQDQEPVNVEWALVREIVAFRRDPDGLDLVCLGFRVSTFNEYVEINEEMENYGQIIETMYDKCQGISHHWWHEIAGVYGTNRMTIYGLPVSEQQKPSAAEQYLMRAKASKIPTGKQLKKIFLRTLLLGLIAFLQVGVSWLITRWDNSQLDEYISMITIPVLLTMLAARIWPAPRVFFSLLLGFYGFEWIIATSLGVQSPTLFGQLFSGNLNWLFLLGAEILIAMFVMLLPDKHAAGRPVR